MEDVHSPTKAALWLSAITLTGAVAYKFPDLLLDPKTNVEGIVAATTINGIALTVLHSYIDKHYLSLQTEKPLHVQVESLQKELDSTGKTWVIAAQRYEKFQDGKSDSIRELEEEIAKQQQRVTDAEETATGLKLTKEQAGRTHEAAASKLREIEEEKALAQEEYDQQDAKEEGATEAYTECLGRIVTLEKEIEQTQQTYDAKVETRKRYEEERKTLNSQITFQKETAEKAEIKLSLMQKAVETLTQSIDNLEKKKGQYEADLIPLKEQLTEVVITAQTAHIDYCSAAEITNHTPRTLSRKSIDHDGIRLMQFQLALRNTQTQYDDASTRETDTSTAFDEALSSKDAKEGEIRATKENLAAKTRTIESSKGLLEIIDNQLKRLQKIKPIRERLIELRINHEKLVERYLQKTKEDVLAETIANIEQNALSCIEKYQSLDVLGKTDDRYVKTKWSKPDWKKSLDALSPKEQLEVSFINIHDVETEISTLKGDLTDTQINSVNLSMENLNEQSESIIKKINTYNREIEHLETKLRTLQLQLVPLNQEFTKQENLLIAINTSIEELTTLKETLGHKCKTLKCKIEADDAELKLRSQIEEKERLKFHSQIELQDAQEKLKAIDLEALEKAATNATDALTALNSDLTSKEGEIDTTTLEIDEIEHQKNILIGTKAEIEKTELSKLESKMRDEETKTQKKHTALQQLETEYSRKNVEVETLRDKWAAAEARWNEANTKVESAKDEAARLSVEKTHQEISYIADHSDAKDQWDSAESAMKAKTYAFRKAKVASLEEDFNEKQDAIYKNELNHLHSQKDLFGELKTSLDNTYSFDKYNRYKAFREILEKKVELLEIQCTLHKKRFMDNSNDSRSEDFKQWEIALLKLECIKEQIIRHDFMREWELDPNATITARLEQSIDRERDYRGDIAKIRHSSCQLRENSENSFVIEENPEALPTLMNKLTIIYFTAMIEKACVNKKFNVFRAIKELSKSVGADKSDEDDNANGNRFLSFFASVKNKIPIGNRESENANPSLAALSAIAKKEKENLSSKTQLPYEQMIGGALYNLLNPIGESYREVELPLLKAKLEYLQLFQYKDHHKLDDTAYFQKLCEAKIEINKAKIEKIRRKKANLGYKEKDAINLSSDELDHVERIKKLGAFFLPEVALFALYYFKVIEKGLKLTHFSEWTSCNISWPSGRKVCFWTSFLHLKISDFTHKKVDRFKPLMYDEVSTFLDKHVKYR